MPPVLSASIVNTVLWCVSCHMAQRSPLRSLLNGWNKTEKCHLWVLLTEKWKCVILNFLCRGSITYFRGFSVYICMSSPKYTSVIPLFRKRFVSTFQRWLLWLNWCPNYYLNSIVPALAAGCHSQVSEVVDFEHTFFRFWKKEHLQKLPICSMEVLYQGMQLQSSTIILGETRTSCTPSVFCYFNRSSPSWKLIAILRGTINGKCVFFTFPLCFKCPKIAAKVIL